MSGGSQTASAAEPLLRVEGLSAGYAGRPVVYDVDLEVNAGEAVAILGSNGAGKTTTLKAIVGLVPPFSASIEYAGRKWRSDKPWRGAGAGIAFIPSERFVFAGLSVDANLALGAYTTGSASERRARLEAVFETFPQLASRRGQLAGTLSGGEQRMLSLGVALMSGPRLLLLDEPSLGLSPKIAEQVMASIAHFIREQGMSVLIVDQDVGLALEIVDRTYIMRSGRVIRSESGDETRARDDWWDFY